MSNSSLMYWNDKHSKTQARELTFWFEITGAKTNSAGIAGYPVLTLYDAVSGQSDIDDFLLTSSEFTAAQFDATAMGTDAFGVIVDMRGRQALGTSSSQTGQADKLVAAEAALYVDDVAITDANATNLALSDSTLEPGASLGANGNLAARFVLAGLDAATDGMVKVTFHWIAK